MTATLDATRTIPTRLSRLHMPHAFFAELCGIHKMELSRLLSGKKTLHGTQTREFNAMLEKLEELARLFHPLPISWRDPKETLELLKDLEAQPHALEMPRVEVPDVRKEWLQFLGESQ